MSAINRLLEGSKPKIEISPPGDPGLSSRAEDEDTSKEGGNTELPAETIRIAPTLNEKTTSVFGIGKGGISRAVVNFSKPPKPQPMTTCFHFPNNFLTHAYVIKAIQYAIRLIPKARIKSLRFVDRNVRQGCTGLENRWVVECGDEATFQLLMKHGIDLCNKHIRVHRYDDVLQEEYEQYMAYSTHLNRLYVQDMRNTNRKSSPPSAKASKKSTDAPASDDNTDK